MNSFDQGQQAYEEGLQLEDNPYLINTLFWQEWHDGWMLAKHFWNDRG